ncbi:MAG: hypothetical protein MUC49_18760 [Raineya sp.]|jgi:hypothetical protein|nr:hypothetical protein [Raineya sp.]
MWQRKIRKWHRYLGLILGIQFLFWTIGGIYFSWTNINEIKGEHLLKPATTISLQNAYLPLDTVFKKVQKKYGISQIESIHVIPLPDGNYYQLTYTKNNVKRAVLCNTYHGFFKEGISQEEAVWVANQQLKYPSDVLEVKKILSSADDIAYRKKPLPAYAIRYGSPAKTTVFVSINLGTVQVLRSSEWRIYDFLWMLHIMDFENRSSFNNLLLRIFSGLGLLTTFSGIFLYVFTNRFYRKLRKNK